jgi:UDP-GlcNAc:undecaprenyl-phosphate GlcNAc-1-phosphate transferase
MYSLGVLAVVSFLVSILLTPWCRNLFRHWGLVDHPDGSRHRHVQPVPRVGGISILTAYLAAFVVLLVVPLGIGRIGVDSLAPVWVVCRAAGLVFLVGLFDDLFGLKPWQKLSGQTIAACMAYVGGVQMPGVAGLALPAWASVLVTVFWLVGSANAFNLIDGLDGLAAGAAFFATITILLGALLTNNMPLALATVPLAGALLGFLRYNFNPASIFLGDSGSLTLGFLLGCYSVLWGQRSTSALEMTAPLMALALPLMDTAIAITRRFLRQQPIFAADAGHIHDRLLARGFSPRRVALVLYGVCGLAATLSLLTSLAKRPFKGAIIVLFCAAAWSGIQHLGYAEFAIVGRIFVGGGAFRRRLNSELALQAFECALQGATSPDEVWETVRTASRKFGFTHAELRVGGCHFGDILTEMNGIPAWNVDIPLGESGRLLLRRCFGQAQTPTMLVAFVEVLHRNLGGFSGQRAAAGNL